MEKKKLVAMDGFIVRPLRSPLANISTETKTFIDSIIEKYARLSTNELVGLSHLTDAYKITTNNEKVMGKKIKKKLALLETFLIDAPVRSGSSKDELPIIDRSDLVPYAV